MIQRSTFTTSSTFFYGSNILPVKLMSTISSFPVANDLTKLHFPDAMMIYSIFHYVLKEAL
jgi:hypothetical protein